MQPFLKFFLWKNGVFFMKNLLGSITPFQFLPYIPPMRLLLQKVEKKLHYKNNHHKMIKKLLTITKKWL